MGRQLVRLDEHDGTSHDPQPRLTPVFSAQLSHVQKGSLEALVEVS